MTVRQGAREGGSARSRSVNITDAAGGVMEEVEEEDVSGKDSRRALRGAD
jgi:hypothetical protein